MTLRDDLSAYDQEMQRRIVTAHQENPEKSSEQICGEVADALRERWRKMFSDAQGGHSDESKAPLRTLPH